MLTVVQMRQELWAVDLSLHYSDTLAMFNLTEFVTGGSLDLNNHYFDIPPPKKEEKKTRRRRVTTAEEVCVEDDNGCDNKP